MSLFFIVFKSHFYSTGLFVKALVCFHWTDQLNLQAPRKAIKPNHELLVTIPKEHTRILLLKQFGTIFHLNRCTLVRRAKTIQTPHWISPLLQVSSQPRSEESTISDSMGGMCAIHKYCVLSCITTTRELPRATMWTITLVMSVCLMHLFFNWKRETWSTWF